MTSKVVCVTSDMLVGSTFLDWSLHWLAGHTQVYNLHNKGWLPLPASPLSDKNAHNHPKNHPAGHSEYLSDVTELAQHHSKEFHTCYPAKIPAGFLGVELGFDENKLRNPKIWQYLITTSDLDYAQIFKTSADLNIPVIYLATNHSNAVYHTLSFQRGEHLLPYEDGKYNDENVYVAFHHWFFKEDMENAKTPWDQRELLALNLQLDSCYPDIDMIDLTVPHLWINCEELWYNGEAVLEQCMEYINEPIDKTRRESWIQIYQQWQQIQQQTLKFCYELDHIVMATVKGWHYPLRPMTLLQEAIIQHRLIYQHNLNIRNWQLESFPDNTQKLHTLLEPNQHALRTTS
jgi:hypothetical protein